MARAEWQAVVGERERGSDTIGYHLTEEGRRKLTLIHKEREEVSVCVCVCVRERERGARGARWEHLQGTGPALEQGSQGARQEHFTAHLHKTWERFQNSFGMVPEWF